MEPPSPAPAPEALSLSYKNFTAVPKAKDNPQPGSNPQMKTRSSEPSQVASSSGVLEKKCIFCGHVKSAKGESLGVNETVEAEQSIRNVAHQIQDTRLFSIIGDYLYNEGPKFSNLEARYHHGCRRKYLHQGEDKQLSKQRSVSNKAFRSLVKHVQDSVLKQNMPELVSSLVQRYKDLYSSFGGDQSDLNSYTGQNLCKRLRGKFGDGKLTIGGEQRKPGSAIVYRFGTSLEDAHSLLVKKESNERSVIRSCAGILRGEILSLKKNPLETDTVDNIDLFLHKIVQRRRRCF